MTAKQYLGQLRSLERRIRAKRAEIDRLRELACSVSGIPGEPTGGSAASDRVGHSAAKIVDLETGLSADIERYAALHREIVSVIDAVPDSLYVDILYRRYIHGQTWEKIAVDMNYAIRHVYRLHGLALREVSRVMQCH